MIIDTSALVAVVLPEPKEKAILSAIAAAGQRRISTGTWLEASIVIDQKHSSVFTTRFNALLARIDAELVPVSIEHATVARAAYERYGRGNHPAKLNYGDCFAYALAKLTGKPLLFKGNDFSQTDITRP